MSIEEGMEVVLQKDPQQRRSERKEEDLPTNLTNRNRNLPRLFLRVLLVESDASTRQIISALLRKCGYNVSAVSDGLKAWETLKGRPNDINLVLTEVELPSISGFSLLTLITEHEIYKNIPVIMMSSQDSVNVVFKCMLRGAADFLIKPVRKNELRNLWQHVWRRQSSGGGGHRSQEGNVVEQKSDAVSENNAASNHSSDYLGCPRKNEECSEKGSDTQSSCTKRDVEAESAYLQNVQDLMQTNCTSLSSANNSEIQKHEVPLKLDENFLIHGSEVEGKSIIMGSEVAPCNEANNSTELISEKDHICTEIMIQNKDVALESQRRANITTEIHRDYYEQVKPSREAIDLIGAFDKHSRCIYRLPCNSVKEDPSNYLKNCSASLDASNKLDSAPLLELTLRRSDLSDRENQGIDEKHILNHSNFSAFSRYTNRTIQPLSPTLAIFSPETKESASNSHKHLSDQSPQITIDAPEWNSAFLKSNRESRTFLVIDQSSTGETPLPCPQLGVIHVPVPARGINRAQVVPLPARIPNSTTLKEPNCEQIYYPQIQNVSTSANQTVYEQNLASMENVRHVSSPTGQSASSSLCNGAISSVKVTPAPVAQNTAETGRDGGILVHDGITGMDSHHSTQRELALSKFRLKRKERCFEKKVRYHSRKRLAEQRPRVKGQFVRHLPADPTSPETEPL